MGHGSAQQCLLMVRTLVSQCLHSYRGSDHWESWYCDLAVVNRSYPWRVCVEIRLRTSWDNTTSIFAFGWALQTHEDVILILPPFIGVWLLILQNIPMAIQASQYSSNTPPQINTILHPLNPCDASKLDNECNKCEVVENEMMCHWARNMPWVVIVVVNP